MTKDEKVLRAESFLKQEKLVLVDYRDVLRKEFLKRRSQNQSYSLRDFARLLNLDASQLSRILHKKSGLSKKNADRVVEEF
jgi:plasmid maintenance system antidote protein VapI